MMAPTNQHPPCWRCHDKYVIHLPAGEARPCPTCFHRHDERHQREIMWMCRPRANYKRNT